MPDFETKSAEGDAICWHLRSRTLKVDGIARWLERRQEDVRVPDSVLS